MSLPQKQSEIKRSQPSSKRKQRLLGIDLCRGIAAYAVVQVHSGDETWGSVEPSAFLFRSLFYFAVPFFLAGSFLFSTRKASDSTSWSFWKSKIERILIPYLIWSILYLIIRSAFFTLTHESARIQSLFQDPLSLVFFGGASYQLYFLPLLFTGTFLILLAHYLEKRKIGIKGLIILAVSSIFIGQILAIYGNNFKLGPNVAFVSLVELIAPDANQNNLIRLILVQISWLIWCLPYVILSMILNRWLNKADRLNLFNAFTSIIFLGLFLIIDVFRNYIPSFSSILLAYLFLLTGISISKYLKDNKFIENVGACSFGIYLIHPIVMNLVKPFVHKLLPTSLVQVSIPSMLAFCIPTFFISWALVSLIKREKRISLYLFGE
ncbi:acyltransferase [Nostoc sp. FACHB-152]|uniref:acyltransferase n=1 Tax=unclassified Nostoc TaxID=2593658 RepID=UPI00168397C1|nr:MULTISPECIES: acyltransferase [unclassified Nostoc]MBD2445782.1 acyltransferase [Nostoc sp. FACHB-152]MBD2466896.1 acyltransferase [Nostoc sp. FACHB-145]